MSLEPPNGGREGRAHGITSTVSFSRRAVLLGGASAFVLLALPPLRAAAPDEKSLAATPDAPFSPGPYTVSWTAVGGDGHPARGTLSFTVE